MAKKTDTIKPRAISTDGVAIYCAFDELQEPNSLKPHPLNPNTHSAEQVALLADIIKQTGWRNAITVSARSGLIIKGHGRLLAAQYAGLKQVPVEIQQYKNESDEMADLVADNRLAELAEINKMQLARVFEAMDQEALALTGYNDAEIGEINDLLTDTDLATEAAEDLVPPAEIDKDPITKPGDLWILGKHKLICGDSTKPETYAALLGDELAKLILTDPPYNVDYEGKNAEKMKIKNDHMDRETFVNFLLAAFSNFKDFSAAGCVYYIWHASSKGLQFEEALTRAGIELRQVLIWVKNTMTLGRQDYQWRHEPCLYGWMEGAAHYFINDRTQTTVTEQQPLQPDKLKKAELLELVKNYLVCAEDKPGLVCAEDKPGSVIFEKRPTRADLHPTMKPVKLFCKQIINSSLPGWIVLDPFGGSGTTLVACELTGRIARLIELDPWYADVIVRRYIEITGTEHVECIRDGKLLPQNKIKKIYEIAAEPADLED